MSDELAFLVDEAAEFGIPWDGAPSVTRETEGPVSFLRWGGGNPDLVLLHGGRLNAHTWDAFALASRRPLLAIDLPGHGESAWREDGLYDPALLAPAVGEVIKAHAEPPVTIVGHSLGGLTGIALAAAQPGLVGRLVLVDVTPGIDGGGPVRDAKSGHAVFASRDEIVESARTLGLGRSREAVARSVWHNTRIQEDGSVIWKYHLGNRDSTSRPGFADPTSIMWPALESFTGPVLLVRGKSGRMSTIEVAELRRHFPGVEVADVSAGHNVQEDAPVELAEVIFRFTDRT